MGSFSLDANMFTTNQIRLTSLLVFVAGLSPLVNAAKWCPREVGGDRCRAPQGQFQCGIFFENLLNNGDIQWVKSLPQALKQVDPVDHDSVFPRLNNKPLKESDFVTSDCQSANRICYALFNQVRSKSLSSTGQSISNLAGKGSAGDNLCALGQRFLRNKGIQRDIVNQKLTFYFSTCGSDWQPVTSTQAGDLAMDEKLCCQGKKYVKC